MKRPLFSMLAALAGLFAILIALDAINFETDRIDRWVMILSFGGVAFFLGLATIDSPGGDASPTGTGTRAHRPKQAVRPPVEVEPPRRPLPRVQAAADRSTDESSTADLDLVALESDPVDSELQGIIDEEQMEEISALVRRAETLEAADAPTIGSVDESEARESADVEPSDPAGADVEPADTPIARLELRLADYDDEALRRVVKESEALVIAEMVRTGQLTSAGELTDRDIASMVFLALTSEEMLAELRMRKALDQPGEVALTDRALAPLKNME